MSQQTVYVQLDIQELLTLADDTKKRLLTADESLKMTSVVKTLAQMTELLRQKDITQVSEFIFKKKFHITQ